MMTLSRRSILQAGSLLCASAALPFPVFASSLNKNQTLVLVEFNGGNDGLNTVIPFTEKSYYEARPNIAIEQRAQLPITADLAFHPSLKPLLPVLEKGDMAVVNGLGYDQPNRSHFRSIEIWDTASESDEFLTEGWLGQLADNLNKPLAEAVVIGRNALPVMSEANRLLVIDSIDKFSRQASKVDAASMAGENKALAHIVSTQNDTREIGRQLQASIQSKKIKLPVFKGGRFGAQLRDAATILLSGHHVPVIKVSIGSFDTHQNQKPTHAQLLSDFAEGMANFRAVLEPAGLWQQTLVMTYSEFGRRVAENGSGGTDHGTAAPHFVFGGRMNGGIFGSQPSLDDLERGDLRFTTHFKSYYQTVLSRWLESPFKLSGDQLGFLT